MNVDNPHPFIFSKLTEEQQKTFQECKLYKLKFKPRMKSQRYLEYLDDIKKVPEYEPYITESMKFAESQRSELEAAENMKDPHKFIDWYMNSIYFTLDTAESLLREVLVNLDMWDRYHDIGMINQDWMQRSKVEKFCLITSSGCKRLLSEIIEMNKSKLPINFCDIGCGAGLNGEIFRRYCKIHEIEIELQLIDKNPISWTKPEDYDNPLPIIKGDYNDNHVKPDYFNVAYCSWIDCYKTIDLCQGYNLVCIVGVGSTYILASDMTGVLTYINYQPYKKDDIEISFPGFISSIDTSHCKLYVPWMYQD